METNIVVLWGPSSTLKYFTGHRELIRIDNPEAPLLLFCQLCLYMLKLFLAFLHVIAIILDLSETNHLLPDLSTPKLLAELVPCQLN